MKRAMPHSFNRLNAPYPIEDTFDFISDFRHASLWDPRTRTVKKLTDGPIGQGTRFLLYGEFLGRPLELPYEIVLYDRPLCLVFAGESAILRYRERVTFKPEAGGTCIEYDATASLKSIFALGNPILALIYQRIGNDATSGILSALDKSLGASRARTKSSAESAHRPS